MAAIDRTNYKRIQRSYYNINIYNDTNDDIEAKYSANTIVPLLDKPNQYEVSVVRASVPLDGIPISQYNIGFESWQVQFTNTQTNDTSNAYVQQFNPNTEPYTDNTALIGCVDDGMLSTILLEYTQAPTGIATFTLGGLLNTPIPAFISGTGVSNITYTQAYVAYCSSPVLVDLYAYNSNVVHNTYNIITVSGRPNAIIRGFCSCQVNEYIYALVYDTGSGEWFIMELSNGANYIFLPTQGGSYLPANAAIYSMTCGYARLSLSIESFSGIESAYTLNYNVAIQGISDINPDQPVSAPCVTYPVTDTVANDDLYTGFISTISQTFIQTDVVYGTSVAKSFNIPNHTDTNIVRFLGSDPWNNLLVCFKTLSTGIYSIVAYDKTVGAGSNSNPIYTMNFGSEPVTMSNFTSVSGTRFLPSLTPNYQIWNYQTYLDQINIAIATAFNGISSSTNWPSQEIPYLSYSNAKFSLNCGTGLALPICKMSFNTRLWQRFIFNSSTNTTNSDYKDLQILSLIPNIVPTTTLMITQPHSTNYRWFDITRVIVRSTKMSVAGDVELTNTSLLNITDFAIDTSAPDVFLQIYEPHILRYYQLYQTSPLNSIDVQLSYATRSGDIFPINLTAGSAASIKLLFRRSNFELAL